MDVLLQHKDDCIRDIEKAKKTGLLPVHVREFKLLMDHIDLTVETMSYKVKKSQSDYEKAKKSWLEKNKVFEEEKEAIRQKALEQEDSSVDFNELRKDRENNEQDTAGLNAIKPVDE